MGAEITHNCGSELCSNHFIPRNRLQKHCSVLCQKRNWQRTFEQETGTRYQSGLPVEHQREYKLRTERIYHRCNLEGCHNYFSATLLVHGRQRQFCTVYCAQRRWSVEFKKKNHGVSYQALASREFRARKKAKEKAQRKRVAA